MTCFLYRNDTRVWKWQKNVSHTFVFGFFLLCKVIVYSSGGDSALAHCENYGGGAEDDVSTGINAFQRGFAVFVDHNISPLVELKAWGCLANQRICNIADSYNYSVNINLKF